MTNFKLPPVPAVLAVARARLVKAESWLDESDGSYEVLLQKVAWRTATYHRRVSAVLLRELGLRLRDVVEVRLLHGTICGVFSGFSYGHYRTMNPDTPVAVVAAYRGVDIAHIRSAGSMAARRRLLYASGIRPTLFYVRNMSVIRRCC